MYIVALRATNNTASIDDRSTEFLKVQAIGPRLNSTYEGDGRSCHEYLSCSALDGVAFPET